jgi:hypothetical protein
MFYHPQADIAIQGNRFLCTCNCMIDGLPSDWEIESEAARFEASESIHEVIRCEH